MNYNIIGMSCCGGCSIRQVVRGAMRLNRPQSWHLGQAYIGFRFAYRNVHYGISSCWNKQLYSWLHAFGTNRHTAGLCVPFINGLEWWSCPVWVAGIQCNYSGLCTNSNNLINYTFVWVVICITSVSPVPKCTRRYLNALSFLGWASVLLSFVLIIKPFNRGLIRDIQLAADNRIIAGGIQKRILLREGQNKPRCSAVIGLIN